MRSAAELAQRFNAYLQTHLAENREEIEKVHNLNMWSRDYTDVYEKCGLLTPKTMLGHCIHLSAREIDAIAAAQASIAHCPTSNLSWAAAFQTYQLLKAGLALGPAPTSQPARLPHVAVHAWLSRVKKPVPV